MHFFKSTQCSELSQLYIPVKIPPQSRCRTFRSHQILHDPLPSILSHHPRPQANTDVLSLYISFHFLAFCVNEITQYLYFCVSGSFCTVYNLGIPPCCCMYQHFVTLYCRATPLHRCTIFCLTQGLSPLPLLPLGPDTSRLLYHRMVSGLPSLKPAGAHGIPFSHWDKQKCIQLPNVSLESKTTPGWEY